MGVQVSASVREQKSATPTVMARARKKTPVTPVMAIKGTKTTIGVSVEPIKGVVNSFSECATASKRFSPASRRRTVFSTTTMASSMISPTAAARPPSDIRLKLSPSTLSAMKVIRMLMGITMPAMNDEPQSCRKSTSTVNMSIMDTMLMTAWPLLRR